MKGNTAALVEKVQNFYNGEPYYGDPILKVLNGINSEKSLTRVGKNAHNIAELLAHIIGWEEYVIKQFKGNKEFQMEQNFSFDWSRIDKNEKSLWASLTAKLDEIHGELISILKDDKYDFGKRATMVNNMMEHDIYHLGQIAILKKIIG
ncbi:MAG: DinB family protein [Bacteroidota bacterium]